MKYRIGVILATTVLVLTGCSQQVIDGKDEIEVPMPTPTPPAKCYLLEIDQEGGNAEDENYRCVSKAEYDRNKLGDQWVDANGKKYK